MKNENIPWFRVLYEALLSHQGDQLYETVLLPWLADARSATADFTCFMSLSEYDASSDDFRLRIWNLYALGRVSDFLLLPFQSDERGEWTGPQISVDQYTGFFDAAGLSCFTSETFSPFHHEIVKVHQSDDIDEPISVVRTVWPGLQFGEMMFSRSGVDVAGGTNHVIKEVAESSTLYFAHRRLHRKTEDLSMGWGHNSQWRTSFRRDYSHQGKIVFNIDGDNRLHDPNEPHEDRDGLTATERLELCRNRCFIHTQKSSDDLWPYDDRYDENADLGV